VGFVGGGSRAVCAPSMSHSSPNVEKKDRDKREKKGKSVLKNLLSSSKDKDSAAQLLPALHTAIKSGTYFPFTFWTPMQ
jgi:hypothetical protein